MLLAFGFGAGCHHALVGGQPVGEGEVAGAGDLDVLKVEAVDGEEVGVDVPLVVQDPQGLADPLGEGFWPGVLEGP